MADHTGERARSARAIIAEMYYPPRVTAAARRLPKYGLEPGLALEITADEHTGKLFDRSIKAQREKAESMLDDQEPILLIGSPMCTCFSVIQAINHAREGGRTCASSVVLLSVQEGGYACCLFIT